VVSAPERLGQEAEAVRPAWLDHDHQRLKAKKVAAPTGNGVPMAANPSFSPTLPGLAPIGVPISLSRPGLV
jgi:hypothetical protein